MPKAACSSPPNVAVRKPLDAAEIAAIKALFLEYAQSLNFSLCFQDFDAEMAGFPGKYAPPGGALLLATVDGAIAGAVGLRDLGAGRCEMKRLYVKPDFRALKLGRKLAEALVAEARALGYRRLLLDTLPTMQSAQALYRSMGFIDIPAYYDNPIDGTRYMELALG